MVRTFLDNARTLEDLGKFCYASGAEELLLSIIDTLDLHNDRLALMLKARQELCWEKLLLRI